MEIPLVSVVIPCYNDHLYIQEAVDSIFKQTYENIEIIIIDDGSNNTTKNVLEELKSDNLAIVTQENSGPSAARNKGISIANGDYILTLDADDFFEPTFIRKSIEVLRKSPKIGLVSSYAYYFSENGIEGEIKPSGGKSGDFLRENNALASSMYRKKCWEEVSGYDENLLKGYEDWDFNISVTKAGWEVIIIEEFLFNYRLKPNSRNTRADDFYRYELLKYIYLKHADVFKDNYENMIVQLVSRMEKCEKEKFKIKNTRTYRLGDFLLYPLKSIAILLRN